MPGIPTPILGLIVPTLSGDTGLWGSEINTNLATLDNLGAATITNRNANYNAAASVYPETLDRVTTGAGVITATLPAPAGVSGKIFTTKKIDSGAGTVSIVVSGGGSIIDGAASFTLTAQYKFLRVVSNGVTYDVLGSN